MTNAYTKLKADSELKDIEVADLTERIIQTNNKYDQKKRECEELRE